MAEFRADLDRYFERIGYRGPRAPSIEVLRELHLLHPQAIPFENLDSFSGHPVVLDPELVQQKLVRDGRGGYCFEQNSFFSYMLKQLGFEVRYRMARVNWMAPDNEVTGRGHMTLNVTAEGKTYLCDVGFGGMTLTAPLLLADKLEQRTPHETFRLRWVDSTYVLEVEISSIWKQIYTFDLLDQYLVDYKAINWFVSTHPDSPFVNDLVIARATERGRLTLDKTRLTVRHADGASEKTTLQDAAAIRSALESYFKIDTRGVEGLDAALVTMISRVKQ